MSDIPFWELIQSRPDVKVEIPYYDTFPDTDSENLVSITFPYVHDDKEYFCILSVDKTTGVYQTSYWAPGGGTEPTILRTSRDIFNAMHILNTSIVKRKLSNE